MVVSLEGAVVVEGSQETAAAVAAAAVKVWGGRVGEGVVLLLMPVVPLWPLVLVVVTRSCRHELRGSEVIVSTGRQVLEGEEKGVQGEWGEKEGPGLGRLLTRLLRSAVVLVAVMAVDGGTTSGTRGDKSGTPRTSRLYFPVCGVVGVGGEVRWGVGGVVVEVSVKEASAPEPESLCRTPPWGAQMGVMVQNMYVVPRTRPNCF